MKVQYVGILIFGSSKDTTLKVVGVAPHLLVVVTLGHLCPCKVVPCKVDVCYLNTHFLENMKHVISAR